MASIDPTSLADNTTPAPANSEPAPAEATLPPELLELPVFAGLLNGAPSAIWVETGSKAPEAVLAVKHGKKLNEAGVFFERSKEEGVDLIFNAMQLSPEVVAEAKKSGKLKTIASPLSEVSSQLNGAVSGGVATPQAGGMPSSVPVDSPLNTARISNLEPGSPTSGPSPGAGRVLNSLQKQAI